VYHYDKEKYQKGTKGTKPCYMGSLNRTTKQIFEKFFSNEDKPEEFEHFIRVWENLKKDIQNENKIEYFESDSKKLELFAGILNELRKIGRIEAKVKKVKSQKLYWSFRCPHCRDGIELYAAFFGVDRRKPVNVRNEPHTIIHILKADAPKDIV